MARALHTQHKSASPSQEVKEKTHKIATQRTGLGLATVYGTIETVWRPRHGAQRTWTGLDVGWSVGDGGIPGDAGPVASRGG